MGERSDVHEAMTAATAGGLAVVVTMPNPALVAPLTLGTTVAMLVLTVLRR
ncbi:MULTISPECIES: hypothetical protein [Streptomyces]|uniref:hypothetical protein n=1 Tax=Streptomyces TaxID=1883 RepID=UPI001358864F|nr:MULTISPECIES: hypothetical protein [Streptomyces]